MCSCERVCACACVCVRVSVCVLTLIKCLCKFYCKPSEILCPDTA